MNSFELDFVRTVRQVGLVRANELMSLLIAYEGNVTQTAKQIKSSKIVVARQFNALFEQPSSAEQQKLDQELCETHSQGDAHTPILTSTGNRKPVMKYEIISYFRANPGKTRAEGAEFLANKFSEHYSSFDEGKRKLMSIICNMAYAKDSQKALEARGGQQGRGVPARIYAI